jgi:hypothetical protein
MLLLSLYKAKQTNKQTRKTREEIKLGKTISNCNLLSLYLSAPHFRPSQLLRRSIIQCH